MNANIYQIIVLAAYGNAYLSENYCAHNFSDHSAFKYCKFVKFVDLVKSDNKYSEINFAETPISWFEQLKSSGVMQLRVYHVPINNNGKKADRKSAIFIGGDGRWLLEAVKETHSDFWESRLEVGNTPEDNLLRFTYGRIHKNEYNPERHYPNLPGINDIKQKLDSQLKKVSEFAYKNGHANFGSWFDRGIKALSEKPDRNINGGEIFPENYAPEECSQLMHACLEAWVFGGMGTWNDISFDDKTTQLKYELLSDKLFELIKISLLIASNPWPRPAVTKE
ncbi:hypothetical protein FE392_06150 [Xenorhabdus sp. 12]|uniref:Uncharacterized protein n=1 Tax=Xenorhabdus santafensis TaxID=2582833 RepID=A0ABU4S7Z6_9GAMM|nr:hypothetical protein [Xenorhabdus sp. 12]MDX7986913.1 hypothetical protein [Xenorhabdus sp. 12]